MAGYRRFIAYVYDYENGKKGSNCGFIKVEVKDQQCSVEIHLHCPGLPENVRCRVYGFIRKDGLINGVLLDTCETEKEIIECMIVTDAMDMNASGISMGKMGGMIITADTGGFFGTEWDDQPIRPEDFHEIKNVPDTDIPADIPENTSSLSGSDSTSVTATIQEILTPDSEKASEEISEDTHEATESALLNTHTAPSTPAASITNVEPTMPQTSTSSRVSAKPVPEEFIPFSDGELMAAWKIQLNDLKRFPQHCCSLRNNRFIQYGQYNFGHLLLGQRNNGQYILGIPGGYNQQERFMANMFGFPYFKESSYVEIPNARGGYWYRLIDAPDSHR